MRFRDDERGQSVQIGAVLLFATLIVAFSSYQAFVVPQQNEEVEFNHNQQVQGEMQDLRNAVVSMAGGGSPRSTSVTLGTTYPSRAVAQNPGPASGSLRTVGATDPAVNISIRNADATGETGDFWNGSARNYSTGAFTYEPGYNRYGEAPTTAYEHSLLYNEFASGPLLTTNQAMVDGERISLVVLNGSLSESSSGMTSVDVRPVSASSRTVSLTPRDADEPVTITLPSRLSVRTWNDVLSDQENARAVPGSVEYPRPFEAVTIELTGSGPHRFQLTKVGVGTRVRGERPAYLTVADGPGTSVSPRSNTEIAIEVRDRYNNPVPGATVRASAESGSLASGSAESGTDGRAIFEYAAPSRGTDRVNVSVEPGYAPDQPGFDPSLPNASQVMIDVDESHGSGGGSGGVTAFWYSPTVDNSGGLSDCSAESCTFDVSEHGDRNLMLRAGTDPAFDGVDVQFRTNDGDIGAVSPASAATEDGGNATTEFTANGNGTVDVFFGSASGRDLLTLTVTGVTGSASPIPPNGEFTYSDQSSDGFLNWDTVSYEFDWQASDPNGDLSSVRLFVNTSDGTVVDSTEVNAGGGSASGTDTLTGYVRNGCNDRYTLTMIVSDQTGRTYSDSATDRACR